MSSTFWALHVNVIYWSRYPPLYQKIHLLPKPATDFSFFQKILQCLYDHQYLQTFYCSWTFFSTWEQYNVCQNWRFDKQHNIFWKKLTFTVTCKVLEKKLLLATNKKVYNIPKIGKKWSAIYSPFFIPYFRRNYSFLNSTLCTMTFGHRTYRCGNYSREETIQRQKLFAEIRYVVLTLLCIIHFSTILPPPTSRFWRHLWIA